MLLFYGHPACSTCKKAERWLDEKGLHYQKIDIREMAPETEVFQRALTSGKLTLKRIFNTSGNRYKELELKDRLLEMSEEEALRLLQTDGMLIRRPVITDGKDLTVGYNEEQYDLIWEGKDRNGSGKSEI